jgi:DNA-binding response OmpR family regulator
VARRRRRVLVVDGDDLIRRLLIEVLTDEGYRVRLAADGQAGLAILRDWLPDAIVLDAALPVPGMDASAFRAAQRRVAGGAAVPVLLAGATAPDRLAALAADLGAAAWLPKPFDLDALVATVARLTGR